MFKNIENALNVSLMVAGYGGAVLNGAKALVPEYAPGEEVFIPEFYIGMALLGLVLGEWGRRSLKNTK